MRMMFPLKDQKTRKTQSRLSIINRSLAGPARASKNAGTHSSSRAPWLRYQSPDAFEDWDTIENAEKVALIFDAMDWFLGGSRPGDAGPGRDRHHQHHAGFGDRAHARDRPAQGPGRDQSQHPDAILSGRRLPYRAERRIGMAIAAGLHGCCWRTLPAPEGFDPPRIVPLRRRSRSFRWPLPESLPDFIPRARPPCCAPVEALRQE